MEEDKKQHCQNCGAPVTTEICPYCHAFTGLQTKEADMEYPVLECKESFINFWNTIFPLMFAIPFGFFGFIFPIIFICMEIATSTSEGSIINVLPVLLFCIIPALLSIGAFIITFKSIKRYLIVKKKGEEIYGTVYGYMDDNLYINGSPAQIVKILIESSEGKRFILYQTGDTIKPYKINSKIKLIVYKNIFLIPKNTEEY